MLLRDCMSLSPDELSLAKSGLEQITKPFSDLIRTLFGGATEEIGAMLTDSFRARRLGRLATKILPKLKAQIEQAGITPGQVPDNIWAPALEAATLTDDETLQEKWAALLSSAADPELTSSVQVCFINILAQLSPQDAKFLDAIFEQATTPTFNFGGSIGSQAAGTERELFALYFSRVEPGGRESLLAPEKATALQWDQFSIAKDNLLRNQLLEEARLSEPFAFDEPQLALTGLGSAFVRACGSRR